VQVQMHSYDFQWQTSDDSTNQRTERVTMMGNERRMNVDEKVRKWKKKSEMLMNGDDADVHGLRMLIGPGHGLSFCPVLALVPFLFLFLSPFASCFLHTQPTPIHHHHHSLL